jgi:hypothetical protein
MYYNIEFHLKKSSFRTVYQLLHSFREGAKIPTMTGIYRWPPLHRPRVTRTATIHMFGPFTIIHNQFSTVTHLQPSPSIRPHHQHALVINTSTNQHIKISKPSKHRPTTHSPSKLRISLHPNKFCCHYQPEETSIPTNGLLWISAGTQIG